MERRVARGGSALGRALPQKRGEPLAKTCQSGTRCSGASQISIKVGFSMSLRNSCKNLAPTAPSTARWSQHKVTFSR